MAGKTETVIPCIYVAEMHVHVNCPYQGLFGVTSATTKGGSKIHIMS